MRLGRTVRKASAGQDVTRLNATKRRRVPSDAFGLSMVEEAA